MVPDAELVTVLEADSSPSTPDWNEEFRPDFRLYTAFGSLCFVVFAASLDALALGSALPVSFGRSAASRVPTPS